MESGEQADLIVKSNSSDGRTNRYWLHGSQFLDAPYWDRYSYNVTDTQWMLIFSECNCPPWQSRFSVNTNKTCKAQLNYCGDDWLIYYILILPFNTTQNIMRWQAWMVCATVGPWAHTCKPPLLIYRPTDLKKCKGMPRHIASVYCCFVSPCGYIAPDCSHFVLHLFVVPMYLFGRFTHCSALCISF